MSEPLAAPARPTNSLALVSLVAGIACWVVVPFVGALVAVSTGHMARAQIRRTSEGGEGMALAGLVLGYVQLGLFLAGFAIVLLVIALGFAVFGFHSVTR